jgi:hypothetical protein
MDIAMGLLRDVCLHCRMFWSLPFTRTIGGFE